MELTFTQFRHAIQLRITELQVSPQTPTVVAEIATLTTLLAGIPVDADE